MPGSAVTPTEPAPAQRAAKKARLMSPDEVTKIATEDVWKASFREGLFDCAEQYAKENRNSGPYRHSMISNLVNEELLRKVREEILTHLCFTPKETDIYKVNQTGDLANIDGLEEEERSKLANTWHLRNSLYSKTFRDFISTVTGCGPLSGSKQDMSVNIYSKGCHLLCHDDVIGTRRVSYILYLPNPDEEWLPSYGGALELYPVVSSGTPATEPTATAQIAFNRFGFFTVQPGYSFHSVQEVVADKERISIQGWFHFPQEGEEGYDPEKIEENRMQASIEQLQQIENNLVGEPFDQYGDLKDGKAEVETLSEQDIQYLQKFINPTYLTLSNLTQINTKFLDESSIQLVDFLNASLKEQLCAALLERDQKDGYADNSAALKHGVGVDEVWKAYGSPVKQRFLSFDSNAASASQSTDQTVPLFQQLQELFVSIPFRKLVSQITSLGVVSHRGLMRRFRPGLDFTLATDDGNSSEILDVTLCLTPSSTFTTDQVQLWKSGELGGYECYVSKDEENEDPSIYRAASEDGALLTIPAMWNVCTIVLRDPGVLRFVKYLSGNAKGSRWDCAFEYGVQMDD